MIRHAKRQRGLRLAVALTASLLVAGLAPEGIAAGSEGDAEAGTAREVVAKRTGARVRELVVVARAKGDYPLQGRTVRFLKVEDKNTGELHLVTLERGREVDRARLEAEEESAYEARYGRFSPELAALVARSASDDEVDVVIWLDEPPYVAPEPPPPGRETTQEEVDRFLRAVAEQRAAVVSRVTAGALQSLRELGYRAEANRYVPVVYATLPVGVLGRVAARPDVDRVYPATAQESELKWARSTIRAADVHTAGVTGTDVRTAQVESRGRVAAANPNLSFTQDDTGVCATPDAHATAVAGVIRSTHATHTGISPGSKHWAGGGGCTGGNTEVLQNRATLAVTWGAQVINLSFGNRTSLVPTDEDKFYDAIAFDLYRTVVKSAGNEAGSCRSKTGDVTNPGLGYNIVTVGAFDDKNSTTWSDDVMGTCSSWNDPIATVTDREKPDVVAPGGDNAPPKVFSTTTASPWVGDVGRGTSLAAPMVTGTVALLGQANANLLTWPTAVRAVLQATAYNNIEGSAGRSEYDGAGGIDARKAYNIAKGFGGTGWNAQFYSCNSGSNLTVGTPYFASGRQTRVAIAWGNNPAAGNSTYDARPSADIDLYVYDKDGNEVAKSVTFSNTWEIVDFKPAVSGTYTIKAKRAPGCSYSPGTLGAAWYNRDS